MKRTAVIGIVVAAAAAALAPAPAGARVGWKNCGDVGGMTAQAWAPEHTPCRVARDIVRYVERHAVLGTGKVFSVDGLTWEGYWYESPVRYRIDQDGRPHYSVRAYGNRLPAGAYGG